MTNPTPAAAAPTGPINMLCLLGATVIGSSVVFIDGTVVNVALPILQRDLGADVVELQWVVEAYAVLLAALLLLGGTLGDRLGRKRMFAFGTIVFAASSAWCGLSPDASQLIGARALQGIGGALLVPGSLALITAHVPAARRGRAIGTWAAFTAVAVALGPVLGGWLIDHASWRWIFFINLPLAVVVLTLLTRIPESRDEAHRGRFDYAGAAFATIGLGALVYGLLEAGRDGFAHAPVVGAMAGGALLLILFVRVEARAEQPMMPLDLFRSRVFAGANAVTFFLYAALSAGLFFLPFNLIQVQGWSALEAGLAFLPLIVLISVCSQVVGRMVDRVGGRWLLIIGSALSALGYGLFMLAGREADYWSSFFPAMSVLGLGMGLAVAPLTSVVMGAVPVARSGVAAGINNTASRLGALLAIAAFGLVMLAAFDARLDDEPAVAALSTDARDVFDAERINLAAAALPKNIDAKTAETLRIAVKDGFVDGYRIVMVLCVALALFASLCAAVTIPRGAIRQPEDSRGT
jgi:EmrB/QacA subfamily drug resistance transporter